MKRGVLLASAFILLWGAVLSGCAPKPVSLPEPTPVGDAVIVAPTVEPTPTPVPDVNLQAVALEEAFQYAKEIARDLSDAVDEKAVFPYSDIRLITSKELSDATPLEMEWAWREIIARHGNKEFQSHDFRDREWYEYDPEFTQDQLSQIEALNIIYLRNAAMEHYSNMKIVKNNRAQADLDGDGKSESFSFTADRFSSSGMLQIGSKKFTVELPMVDSKLYLCNMDHFDARQELAIPFTRDGTDDRIAFYAYDGEGLILLGEVQGTRDTIRLLDKGVIKAHGLDTQIGMWRYPMMYDLVGDRLVPRVAQTRKIGMRVTLLRPIALTDASGNAFSLPEGNELWIMAVTPYGEYIVYHQGSDRYGTFSLEEGLLEGLTPQEVFEGLPKWA